MRAFPPSSRAVWTFSTSCNLPTIRPTNAPDSVPPLCLRLTSSARCTVAVQMNSGKTAAVCGSSSEARKTPSTTNCTRSESLAEFIVLYWICANCTQMGTPSPLALTPTTKPRHTLHVSAPVCDWLPSLRHRSPYYSVCEILRIPHTLRKKPLL